MRTVSAQEKSFSWLLVGCFCVLAAGPARAFDTATADRVLLFARQQLEERFWGCASAPGSAFATVGLLLCLLRLGRRPRSFNRSSVSDSAPGGFHL